MFAYMHVHLLYSLYNYPKRNLYYLKLLSVADIMNMTQTAFIILSGQGEALNIDPQHFYKHLYGILPQLTSTGKYYIYILQSYSTRAYRYSSTDFAGSNKDTPADHIHGEEQFFSSFYETHARRNFFTRPSFKSQPPIIQVLNISWSTGISLDI